MKGGKGCVRARVIDKLIYVDAPKSTRCRLAGSVTLGRCSVVVRLLSGRRPTPDPSEPHGPRSTHAWVETWHKWPGEPQSGDDTKAHVVFRCRRIGHDDDPGRQPGISLKNQLGRTLESSQNMRTNRDWQLLEPAYVLAGYDEKTIQIGPTHYDDIRVNVLDNVRVPTTRPVVGHRLRNCATAAFRLDGDVVTDKPQRAVAFIHVLPSIPLSQ